MTRYSLFASLRTMLYAEKKKRIARVLPGWKMCEKRRDVLKMHSLNCEKCNLLLFFFASTPVDNALQSYVYSRVVRIERRGVVTLPQNSTINNNGEQNRTMISEWSTKENERGESQMYRQCTRREMVKWRRIQARYRSDITLHNVNRISLQHVSSCSLLISFNHFVYL